MSSKNKTINFSKDELYDLYITKKLTSKEIGQLYDCTSKTVRNYLYKYGIPVRQNGEAVKLERSKWSLEKEQQRTRKFITTLQNKSPEERQRITANARAHTNNALTINKARETKFANQTYRKSATEDAFYRKLLCYFDDNDIIRGYIDKNRYPFNCDFYIPSRDLFIEFQGHQTHGYEPYDIESVEHYNYLQKMLSKNYDMTTWTVRDVHKIYTAEKNKIKLLLIYPKNNTFLIKNGKITDLGHSNEININAID